MRCRADWPRGSGRRRDDDARQRPAALRAGRVRAVARHVAPSGAQRSTVELEREQARARQFDVEYGQLSLEQSTWGMPARVEKIARESLRMQLPAASRVEVVRTADEARTPRSDRAGARHGAQARGRRAPRRRAAARARSRLRCSAPSGCCSSCCSAARCSCSGWTTTSCRSQGAARFSREIEVPAHRGRIVDRFGDALAISTPVKSLWVFRDKFDATPEQLRKLARVLETTPQQLSTRIEGDGEFAFVARAARRRRRRSARWRSESRD